MNSTPSQNASGTPAQQTLHKLEMLPPEKIEEVSDFIDFLFHREQDQVLTRKSLEATAPILTEIWDNPDDAEYDKL